VAGRIGVLNTSALQDPPASPWGISADWPQPDEDALVLSKRLVEMLRERIDDAGGSISFADYMEKVLYAPGVGYYSAGLRKFGSDGDFVTAPEISPLFARCFARTCNSILNETGGKDILELGAGSGVMAANLLAELERMQCLPERYLILERSAELRDRQQETLSHRIPHLLSRIQWLNRLPEPQISGLIFANEVIDALPVHRFAWRDNELLELHVTWRDDTFAWVEKTVESMDVAAQVKAIGFDSESRNHFTSEINPGLKDWLASLASRLARGAMVFTDYGYPRSDYYHPQRSSGTLMCHYRHRSHGDPFLLPGLQDVTAYVDFTALAEAGNDCGLAVKGFTTQAHFLMDTDIETLLAEAGPENDRNYLEAAQQVKTMMLPGEMGERFKAMLLLKGIESIPAGFRLHDLRTRL